MENHTPLITVIAEYQHIIYNEWLPAILGEKEMTTRFEKRTEGYSTSYYDRKGGSIPQGIISNEFSTAAFRFGHSLIPNSFFGIKEQNRCESFYRYYTFCDDISCRPHEKKKKHVYFSYFPGFRMQTQEKFSLPKKNFE